MRRLGLILALALGVLFAPASALAASPSKSTQTLIETAEARLDGWRAARARTRAARLEQSALARRIDALKRDEASGPASGALEALLRRSLEVEGRLEAALRAEAGARGEVTRAVRGGVRRIDRRIRAAVPKLKQGPLADRRAAARHINRLRAARQALRGVVAQLDARSSGAPRAAWARYEVSIEPLDGPSELEEKAEFVEDTRDKLRKKRRALARLLGEAKQEREIARAARDFDTYVRLFDEEARTDRVTRQGSSAGDATNLAAGGSTNNGNPSAPTVGRGTDDGATADPTTPNEGATPPDFSNSPPNNATGGLTDGPGTESGAGGDKVVVDAPEAPTVDPTTSGPGVTRDIDADVLINLRVDELAGQGLDLATLERLVAELEALDGYLDAQSQTIRQRARDLEADEAKALGKE